MSFLALRTCFLVFRGAILFVPFFLPVAFADPVVAMMADRLVGTEDDMTIYPPANENVQAFPDGKTLDLATPGKLRRELGRCRS